MKQTVAAVELLSYRARVLFLGLLALQVILAVLDSLAFATLLLFTDSLLLDSNQRSTDLTGLLALVPFAFDGLRSGGFAVLAIFAIRIIMFTITGYFQAQFFTSIGTQLSAKIYGGYLHQPFEAMKNSGVPNMHRDSFLAFQFIEYSLAPLLSLTRESAIVLGILFVVLQISPLLPLLVMSFMGVVLVMAAGGTHRLIRRLGQQTKDQEVELSSLLGDSLSAAIEIQMYRKTSYFISRFKSLSHKRLRSMNSRHLVEALTPYVLETALVSMMVLFVVSSVVVPGSGQLSFLIALGIGSLRIMPSVGRMVVGIQTLSFGISYIRPPVLFTADDIAREELAGYSSLEEVSLQNVCFRFPNQSQLMLKELTTTFKSGELTAVVGESGRGKTTLIGILLGFYRPTTGEVRWNSSRLESQSQLQQYRISYIPQVSAYLNDSLIHNITLGTALTDASRVNLKRLARIFLDQPTLELIEKEFEAHPVELGLKISGGQRQRLAILRAVFHKPDIVILDEATNALDLDAELNMIVRMKRELPESIIIAVTHSPEVARHADAVLELS